MAAGPYAEIFYLLCRPITSDPSSCFGIRYAGRKRCSAYTRTFSKLSTSLLTDTKSLRRGGPLCPPALPDMLAVLESVTAGRRGSRPLRGNCLHVLPSHYAGSVDKFRNRLPRAETVFRLFAEIVSVTPHHETNVDFVTKSPTLRGNRSHYAAR